MKIKDLPKDKPLGGVVFIHPESGEHCIWKSQWGKGVWFTKDAASDQVFPLALENLEDALQFEVVDARVPGSAKLVAVTETRRALSGLLVEQTMGLRDDINEQTEKLLMSLYEAGEVGAAALLDPSGGATGPNL